MRCGATLIASTALLCGCGGPAVPHPAVRATSAPLVVLRSFASPVVPQPKHLTAYHGTFAWPARLRVAAAGSAERACARMLAQFVRASGGMRIAPAADRAHADVVFARARPFDAQLGAEGYVLAVRPAGIRIVANGPAGFDYAVQTLAQLTDRTTGRRLRTPLVNVRDWPSYRWRGIHLDVSRHFFSPATVKRYLDLAERYKLNEFHWHLTDDDAWRLEIPARPRLAAVGSCSRGVCAYYTRADVRAIVAYARERHIDVVPEIDVPDHSSAAIRAYPALSCGRVRSSLLCPTEETFATLTDVLREVTGVFPGPYVHLGGDEVSDRGWRGNAEVRRLMQRTGMTRYAQVQGYFTKRLSVYLAAHGRRAIVWDDALAGGAPDGVLVMGWRGEPAVRATALRGREVIATPNVPLYLNGPYPNALRDVYGYDPLAPHATPQAHRRVLGIQANVWTEKIRTPERLFSTLLPRELALSEIAWSGATRPGWANFTRRLPAQVRWLSAHGYAR